MKAFFANLLLSISKVSVRKWFMIIGTIIGIALLVFEVITFAQLLQFLGVVAGIPLMIIGFNRVLSIALITFLLFGLSSCMTYEKALRKFALSKTDTVYVTEVITQKVPADSISYIVPLDHLSKIETAVWAQSPSGAKVIIQPEVHEKVKYIRISSECPEKTVSTSITRPTKVITTNTWGVSPAWKMWTKILAFALLAILIGLGVAYFFKKIKFLPL